MDENLARWIYLSVAKHFKPIVETGLSLPYFVEGVDERSDDDMRADHIELRFSGPETEDYSGSGEVRVAINFICTALMDMVGADAWRMSRWTGRLQYEMKQPIPVYKYGTGADDDQSLIGCLRVVGRVTVYPFGQLDRDTRVVQSEVDALFRMDV